MKTVTFNVKQGNTKRELFKIENLDDAYSKQIFDALYSVYIKDGSLYGISLIDSDKPQSQIDNKQKTIRVTVGVTKIAQTLRAMFPPHKSGYTIDIIDNEDGRDFVRMLLEMTVPNNEFQLVFTNAKYSFTGDD